MSISLLEIKDENGVWFLPDSSNIRDDGVVVWSHQNRSGVATTGFYRLSEHGKEVIKNTTSPKKIIPIYSIQEQESTDIFTGEI